MSQKVSFAFWAHVDVIKNQKKYSEVFFEHTQITFVLGARVR